jgi:GNAT superfamily N-acetyltransferase
MTQHVEVHPLTPERWPDLEAVFGPNGANSGCWCMWFKQTNAEYERDRGAPNREALRDHVDSGVVPGLIAYVEGAPAAWVAVEPRPAYPRLDRSPVTRPLDDAPAWAIPCFFTHRNFRGLGLQAQLLDAAVAWAAAHGATLVEGYPVDPAGPRISDASGFHGFLSAFCAAGFDEQARRRPDRPFVRRAIPQQNPER